MTRLPWRRPLGWIAAELGLQFHQIGEDVGLTPQLVGDHRRLARNRRYDGNADAAALHRFDQRAEIAIAGKQHDLIYLPGEFHRVDREFDTHVAFDFAPANAIVEL